MDNRQDDKNKKNREYNQLGHHWRDRGNHNDIFQLFICPDPGQPASGDHI